MTLHVDIYNHTGLLGPDPLWLREPRRCEDVDDMDYLRTAGGILPYCNGYTWRTPPHEDGECEQWEPPISVLAGPEGAA